MTQEKESQKTRMKLFDYIFESSIKSSKTIIGIVNELVALADDINSLRLSLISLSKVIQTHQQVLNDLCAAIEAAAVDVQKKESSVSFPSINNDGKKDKPN